MSKIKPCPFCGNKARVKIGVSRFFGVNGYEQVMLKRSVYVVCNKCWSRGKPVTYVDYASNMVAPYSVQEEAIENWNRRV